jgi:putative membrane protein
MTHRVVALAAAAAFGIGSLCTNLSYGADPGAPGNTGSSITGSSGSSDMSGQTVTSGARPTDVGPIGGEFALNNNGMGGDLREALDAANDPDKFFLVCAAIDNQAEIQLAQLAEQRAQDPQVKQIAQQVQKDHEQAQNDLRTTAQQASVTIPTSMPMIKQKEMKMFQSLNGKEFDQQYISHMRACHARAVSEYQDVAQLAKNDQVKSYASKTLPSLQKHYQQVQQAATALGLPNTNEAQPAGARMSGESGSSGSINQMSSPGRMDQSNK